MVVGNGAGHGFWLCCNVVVVPLNMHGRELILHTNTTSEYKAHCALFHIEHGND